MAVAGSTVGAQAPVPASSSAKAKEVVSLMSAKKLESFAARDPENAGEYVAALLIPNVQLLVVSAKYSRDNDIEYALYHKQYSNAYSDLRSGIFSSNKFFVDDALGDGLIAVPGKNPQHDVVTIDTSKHVFDGLFDPKGRNKKPLQDVYMKTFADADARYAHLLDVLISKLKAGDPVAGPAGLR
jgi:hypothetical protein